VLTTLYVYNEKLLDVVEFPLVGVLESSDPLQIRNIDGLGPVKADIASTPFATGRGAFHQGDSTGVRNIVLTVGLNPDWADQSVAALRQMLYAYFMPEKWTRLSFFSDELSQVDIDGVVESFEPNIFSQDPEIQVSILCHRPDFIDPNEKLVTGIVPNSLVDGAPIQTVINYEGTAPTGFELRVKLVHPKPIYLGRLIVVNQGPTIYETFEMDEITLDVAHYFMLTTIKTARRVEEIYPADNWRGNLLANMKGGSKWPELKPGENTFSVGAEQSGLKYELRYYNRFGGL